MEESLLIWRERQPSNDDSWLRIGGHGAMGRAIFAASVVASDSGTMISGGEWEEIDAS